MKGNPLEFISIHIKRSILHPGRLALPVLLALVLVPALACNLSSRHPDGLVFPTDRPDSNPPSLDAPSGNIAEPPVSTSLPVLSLATDLPSQPVNPIQGLQTATPGPGSPGAWQTPEPGVDLPAFDYWTQPGDTLAALAARFAVSPQEISPPQPPTGLLQAGQQLTIPNLLGQAPYPSATLPDSVVVYSPESVGFQVDAYILQAGGYLSTYREQMETGEWLSGSEIVRRVASEASINPQVLLAFLEFRSGWVRGQLADPAQAAYPIGFYVPDYTGLYKELSLVAKELNIGYYGWRDGSFSDLVFADNSHVRVSPALNAGTVAVQNLTSKFYRHQQDWLEALYGPRGFLAVFSSMFGDPWAAAAAFGPLFPPGLAQPNLELPFAPGEDWSLTAGPHTAWRTGTPRGALDFAPITGEPPCAASTRWVTASAAGLVVRSGDGLLALDLDGDGLEQTGWELVYLHIADQGKLPVGTLVNVDDPLGHPSCEGGQATGTHVHLARKYNGEWLAADGPLPMVLSGWVAHASEKLYEGTLTKDGQTVSAHPDGSSGSKITR